MTAANQQERLSITEQQRWYLAGFIEGEGSVCVSIKEHPTTRFGYYVDPEFFLYQHRDYPQLLELAQKMFGRRFTNGFARSWKPWSVRSIMRRKGWRGSSNRPTRSIL